MSELFPDESDNLADFQSSVMRQLAEAAGNGLASSKLMAKKPKVRASQERILREMEQAGTIKSLRKDGARRIWLTEHVPAQVTPEEKADEVLRRVLPEQRRERLLTPARIRDELLKGLGIKDAAIRTCLRVLEQEGLLVKLTEGTKTYYAYVPALRTLLDEASPPQGPAPAPTPVPAPVLPVEPIAVTAAPATPLPAAPAAKQISARELAGLKPLRTSEPPLPVTNQRVIEAYRSVRLQRRLPDVEIARLGEVLNCTVEELKPVVLRLCEQGVFIPGRGDWSFASTAARAAAVLIQGEPHLFVRIKE